MSDIQNIAFERGKALYELKRYNEALKELFVSYNFDANHYDTIMHIAFCYYYSGNQENCEKFAKELVSKFPDYHHAHYVLSYFIDTIDLAISSAKKSLELEPDYLPTIALLASLEIQNGNPKEALIYIDLGLSLDPTDVDLLIYKLQYFTFLKEKKHSIEAENIIKILLDAEPNNDSVHYEIAEYYCDIFRFENAITHYKKTISLNPQRKDIRIKLAETRNKINSNSFFGIKMMPKDTWILFSFFIFSFVLFVIFISVFEDYFNKLKFKNQGMILITPVLFFFLISFLYLLAFKKYKISISIKKWFSKYTTEEPGLIWDQDVYFGVPVTQKFSFMYVIIFLCNFICMFLVVAMVIFVIIKLKIENNTESKSIILTTLSVAFLGIFVFPEILYFQYLKYKKFIPISKFNSKKHLFFFPIFIIIMKVMWRFVL
ncbi:MAG: hypothetical protein EAZ27_12205 [Cytophagales bacterium]|nr:MAG: hypothetical protein EAZ27_12205 [Cytophagales bacterium]